MFATLKNMLRRPPLNVLPIVKHPARYGLAWTGLVKDLTGVAVTFPFPPEVDPVEVAETASVVKTPTDIALPQLLPNTNLHLERAVKAVATERPRNPLAGRLPATVKIQPRVVELDGHSIHHASPFLEYREQQCLDTHVIQAASPEALIRDGLLVGKIKPNEWARVTAKFQGMVRFGVAYHSPLGIVYFQQELFPNDRNVKVYYDPRFLDTYALDLFENIQRFEIAPRLLGTEIDPSILEQNDSWLYQRTPAAIFKQTYQRIAQAVLYDPLWETEHGEFDNLVNDSKLLTIMQRGSMRKCVDPQGNQAIVVRNTVALVVVYQRQVDGATPWVVVANQAAKNLPMYREMRVDDLTPADMMRILGDGKGKKSELYQHAKR